MRASRSSLLRWPGGKHFGKRMMMTFVPASVRSVCSPFFGEGSVEIGLASRGARVYGYDIDGPLVNFWQQVLRHPDAVADALEPYVDRYISRDAWRGLAAAYENERSAVRKAAIFWLRNNWSYAGGTLSGAQTYFVGRRDLTLLRSTLARRVAVLRRFRSPNLVVERGSYVETIARHPDEFLVLDPPYPELDDINAKYAGSFTPDEHRRFASILNARQGWLLVVNDVPVNHELYPDRRRYAVTWAYTMARQSRAGNVLLVVSDDVAVPPWAASYLA